MTTTTTSGRKRTTTKIKKTELVIPVGEAYHVYVERVKARAAMLASDQHLFTTDTPNLFEAFLKGIPDDAKQYHTCTACKKFINAYGGLVLITNGMKLPIFWALEDTPEYYHAAITNIIKAIEQAKVTGVFRSSETTWGSQYTGDWEHFGHTPGKLANVYWDSKIQTASQKIAEQLEEYGMLCRNIEKYSLKTLEQAMMLLDIDDLLYRSEKVLGHARWLRDLKQMRSKFRGEARNNQTWKVIASAPAGWAHISTTMIGTLLDDLESGDFTFDEVKKRFGAKMHPEKYRMPTAPPKAGNIAQAEKIVEALGIWPSLSRRFARIEEVPLIWSPRDMVADADRAAGVFAHLKKPAKVELIDATTSPITMTWEKFQTDVLPTAYQIEFFANTTSYGALTAPVNADAPFIFQWNSSLSFYTYTSAMTARHWNLRDSAWVDVTGIAYQPTMLDQNTLPRFDLAVFFLLQGCVDTSNPTTCLFAEILKGELKSIETTIVAHSKSEIMAGRNEASACGLRLSNGNTWRAKLRVTRPGMISTYILDRWN